MSDTNLSQEQRILRMVKRVLTDVVKDTTTAPGLKHPLSEHTLLGIKQCLDLITSREIELHTESGQATKKRPYFIDEPQHDVRVELGKREKET